MIPVVYGFSDKKVFHTSAEFNEKLYLYGGIDNSIKTLNFPNVTINSINETLHSYIRRCKI